MSVEAMKQALEALELARSTHDVMLLSDPPQRAWKYHGVDWKLLSAVQHLRQAIAEAEKQEPVGYFKKEGDVWNQYYEDYPNPDELTALYTNPQPKREPLTVKDIKRIATYCGEHITDEDVIDITRRVEAAHGITSDMKQEHVDKT